MYGGGTRKKEKKSELASKVRSCYFTTFEQSTSEGGLKEEENCLQGERCSRTFPISFFFLLFGNNSPFREPSIKMKYNTVRRLKKVKIECG